MEERGRERKGGREGEREGERERERERENESQVGSMLSVQSPTWGSNSRNHKIMTSAETKSRTLNRLSHPGVPTAGVLFRALWQ